MILGYLLFPLALLFVVCAFFMGWLTLGSIEELRKSEHGSEERFLHKRDAAFGVVVALTLLGVAIGAVLWGIQILQGAGA